MSLTNEAVIYARYSGDRQRETSIDDQVRNCTRFAEREGLSIKRIYGDKAMTGACRNRPAYLEMLDNAVHRSFAVLLVDDLSRLSRDDYEMKGVLRKLAWQGVRVIGITDGYDSTRKGHKIHAGFKGLMNELFLDDLRERTHRGMSGQAIKGYNCGGRTFGYRNVPIEDGTRRDAYGRPAVLAVEYEIDDAQAMIVRQIHERYAAGYSYKAIAAELNRTRVPSSRGSSWASTAIKVILENEMYEGRLIWNRRAWAKHPETGKRTYQERPRAEWIVAERSELRIVPQAVIDIVRYRQNQNKGKYPNGFGVSSGQRYLLSGLMTCAECLGAVVIVGKDRYGCATFKTRGPAVCGNGVTISRHILEERLLHGIKSRLLEPSNVDEFAAAASRVLDSHSTANSNGHVQRQLHEAELIRDNILMAIKQGILTASTKAALETAESEVAALNDRILRTPRHDIPAVLPDAVKRYREAVSKLQNCLADRVEPAREILKSVIGAPIRIHRRNGYLEAEVPNGMSAILTKHLKTQSDLGSCGGPICRESDSHSRSGVEPVLHEPFFVSFAPEPSDCTPMRWRRRELTV